MSAHLLDVRNLWVRFNRDGEVVNAVDDVSFHVDPGETLVILGESGSGKSVSTMSILDLVEAPPAEISKNSIFYDGADMSTMSRAQRRSINGRRISIIFQDPLSHLNPVYSVGWQIGEVFRAHRKEVRETDIHGRTIELLERVGLPDPPASARRYPHEFSGGQRQRIMIAMALALRPDILIADEPTTALDVTVQAEILELIKRIQAEDGMALILITHDLAVAAFMGDRIAVMQNGRVVETGEVMQVLSEPRHSYTRALLSARVGGEAAETRSEEVILRVDNLSKEYVVPARLLKRGRSVSALRDVSFELRRGETLGIVGESGSGKTTVARTLMRIGDATAGTARIGDTDILQLRPSELYAVRRKMQMVFQDPFSSLNPTMTVEQILSEPWIVHPEILPRGRWRARAAELLHHVGLKESHLARYPHEFSGGQRQRIAIARALAVEPEIIICDEAVSALDVSVQAQVINLLKDLQARLNVAYIFISHDLEVVRGIAHRVAVMKNGEIVEQGPTSDIFERPQHPYTRKLLGASLRDFIPGQRH
ncbi:ABC transporter ATP-binding protein [Starkeya sp. ORNL1]|uniref:ABC transporter ATP-binding protein n=1 Tax=Starkeya sp. ORNL1 TaxID=2709380 RepID=UPI0014629D7F|nr:ABC transporter ATP-binding protein [Starkeya sp. ORNL1]QJP16108.1 ABC transporter ATP-binding protein [Starkeya sp. ORNL1]